MENIYISGFEGNTRTFHIPSSKMKNYSILDLKKQIRDRTGVAICCQRLLYGMKELEDTRNGVVMTFQDYEIKGGASIVMVIRLLGYKYFNTLCPHEDELFRCEISASGDDKSGIVAAGGTAIGATTGAGIGATVGMMGGPVGVTMGGAIGGAVGGVVGGVASLFGYSFGKN